MEWFDLGRKKEEEDETRLVGMRETNRRKHDREGNMVTLKIEDIKKVSNAAEQVAYMALSGPLVVFVNGFGDMEIVLGFCEFKYPVLEGGENLEN